MGDYRQEVAGRLRVLVNGAGGPASFAAKLGMRDTSIQDYLRAKALPGNKFRQRMRDAGMKDEEFWLMHGTNEEANTKWKKSLLADLAIAHPVEAEMLKILRDAGIESPAELKKILEGWNGMTKMVAETKVKYKVKKGR